MTPSRSTTMNRSRGFQRGTYSMWTCQWEPVGLTVVILQQAWPELAQSSFHSSQTSTRNTQHCALKNLSWQASLLPASICLTSLRLSWIITRNLVSRSCLASLFWLTHLLTLRLRGCTSRIWALHLACTRIQSSLRPWRGIVKRESWIPTLRLITDQVIAQ